MWQRLRTLHRHRGGIAATVVATPLIEAHYDQFITEPAALTRKFGVAIQSIGLIILADEPGAFRNVISIAYISSGDLYPEFPGI